MSEAQSSAVKICRRKQSFPTKTDCIESAEIKVTDACVRSESGSSALNEGIKDKKVTTKPQYTYKMFNE